ncbi:hypothetical protein E2542_SST21925 [Spatholobus suberectus]|nr:hypothetical protein E2542_SST21925 [Spatholobus suberectus]
MCIYVCKQVREPCLSCKGEQQSSELSLSGLKYERCVEESESAMIEQLTFSWNNLLFMICCKLVVKGTWKYTKYDRWKVAEGGKQAVAHFCELFCIFFNNDDNET